MNAVAPRRLAGAALFAVLVGCAPTPQPNPAEATVLAYIPSIDAANDAKWCELDWTYKDRIDECKQLVAKSPGPAQLTGSPTILRRLAQQDPAVEVVVARLPYKLYTPVQAYEVRQDPATGRWLVTRYAEVHGNPDDDANVRSVLP